MQKPIREYYNLINDIITLNQFKSIDSLITCIIKHDPWKSISINDLIDHITLSHSSRLMYILKLKTNKNSIHDLMIIDYTSKHLKRLEQYVDKYTDTCFNQILEVYKNRKV